MSEFQVKIISESGIVVASTYVTADGKQQIIEDLRMQLSDAENDDSDWLDGLSEDEAE